jgi:L-ascorbate metabolism protein UlaG (beta-lactamase superfamily)
MHSAIRSVLVGLLTLVAAVAVAGKPGLGSKLAPGEATIVAWSHSGVGVETARHFLIFDYIRLTARDNGRIVDFLEAGELPGKRPVVFVTHAHRDHHDDVIYEWAETLPDLHYVISEDVARTSSFRRADLAPGRVSIFGPGERRRILGGVLEVRTVESADAGVAFRAAVDGLEIVHTGDHALWAWNEEKADAGRENYLGALRRLVPEGDRVDIAFLCADLRVPGLSGAAEATALLDPGMVVAIHNYSHHAQATAALREAVAADLRGRVAEVRGAGTILRFPR